MGREQLYVTVTSDAFRRPTSRCTSTSRPDPTLRRRDPRHGKEYGGLVPALPFTPDPPDRGARGSPTPAPAPTTACTTPAAAWATRATRWPGIDVLVSSDQRTLSVAVPWTALGGCPTGDAARRARGARRRRQRVEGSRPDHAHAVAARARRRLLRASISRTVLARAASRAGRCGLAAQSSSMGAGARSGCTQRRNSVDSGRPAPSGCSELVRGRYEAATESPPPRRPQPGRAPPRRPVALALALAPSRGHLEPALLHELDDRRELAGVEVRAVVPAHVDDHPGARGEQLAVHHRAAAGHFTYILPPGGWTAELTRRFGSAPSSASARACWRSVTTRLIATSIEEQPEALRALVDHDVADEARPEHRLAARARRGRRFRRRSPPRSSSAPHSGQCLWPWNTRDRQRGHALSSSSELQCSHALAFGATPAPHCGHASRPACERRRLELRHACRTAAELLARRGGH